MCSLKSWTAAAKTLRGKEMICVGNPGETSPANGFCQLPLVLACKFISEQTSCTHLLSTASVKHSKRIIVSRAQHMGWWGRKNSHIFWYNFSHMFLITSWHWHQHRERKAPSLGLNFTEVYLETLFWIVLCLLLSVKQCVLPIFCM